MTQTNISNTSALIRPNDKGTAIDLLFRTTDFLNWCRAKGLVVENAGGLPHKWNLQTSGNDSAEEFVEGQAIGLAGTPGYREASITTPIYVRTIAQATGHVRDQQNRGGYYEDPVKRALDDATIALYKAFDDKLLGSTVDASLAAAVDSTTLHAGIDPGVVTEWASLETNVGGALTAAVLETMWLALKDAPRGADPDVILSGLTQRKRYCELVGIGASGARVVPRTELGQAIDLGVTNTASVSFNGVGWDAIRGMTATELYMLDLVGGGFEVRMQRDIDVLPLAVTSDSQSWQLSLGYIVKVMNRRKHGKLTGLTSP